MKWIIKIYDFLVRPKCECCKSKVKNNKIHHFAMGLYGYEQICESCVLIESKKRGWSK